MKKLSIVDFWGTLTWVGYGEKEIREHTEGLYCVIFENLCSFASSLYQYSKKKNRTVLVSTLSKVQEALTAKTVIQKVLLKPKYLNIEDFFGY